MLRGVWVLTDEDDGVVGGLVGIQCEVKSPLRTQGLARSHTERVKHERGRQ